MMAEVPEQPSKKAKVEESEAPTTAPAAPAPPAAPAAPAPAPTPTPAAPVAPASTAAPAPAPAPIIISEALAKFFGTSEKEMPQSEVYKRIEEYIKAEGLEVGHCLLQTFILTLY